MFAELRGRLDGVSLAFGRLTQREQAMVVGGGAASVVLILTIVGLLVGNAISKAEHRVKTKTDALTQILQLQGEYRAKKAAQDQQMQQLSGSGVRLVKVVEDAARAAGIDKNIGRMQPEDREPTAEGIIESTVEVSATDLSVDRLQDFMSRLQQGGGVIVVSRLKVNKPYRKETLDTELLVTTYRGKE